MLQSSNSKSNASVLVSRSCRIKIIFRRIKHNEASSYQKFIFSDIDNEWQEVSLDVQNREFSLIFTALGGSRRKYLKLDTVTVEERGCLDTGDDGESGEDGSTGIDSDENSNEGNVGQMTLPTPPSDRSGQFFYRNKRSKKLFYGNYRSIAVFEYI